MRRQQPATYRRRAAGSAQQTSVAVAGLAGAPGAANVRLETRVAVLRERAVLRDALRYAADHDVRRPCPAVDDAIDDVIGPAPFGARLVEGEDWQRVVVVDAERRTCTCVAAVYARAADRVEGLSELARLIIAQMSADCPAAAVRTAREATARAGPESLLPAGAGAAPVPVASFAAPMREACAARTAGAYNVDLTLVGDVHVLLPSIAPETLAASVRASVPPYTHFVRSATRRVGPDECRCAACSANDDGDPSPPSVVMRHSDGGDEETCVQLSAGNCSPVRVEASPAGRDWIVRSCSVYHAQHCRAALELSARAASVARPRGAPDAAAVEIAVAAAEVVFLRAHARLAAVLYTEAALVVGCEQAHRFAAATRHLLPQSAAATTVQESDDESDGDEGAVADDVADVEASIDRQIESDARNVPRHPAFASVCTLLSAVERGAPPPAELIAALERTPPTTTDDSLLTAPAALVSALAAGLFGSFRPEIETVITALCYRGVRTAPGGLASPGGAPPPRTPRGASPPRPSRPPPLVAVPRSGAAPEKPTTASEPAPKMGSTASEPAPEKATTASDPAAAAPTKKALKRRRKAEARRARKAAAPAIGVGGEGVVVVCGIDSLYGAADLFERVCARCERVLLAETPAAKAAAAH